MYFICMFFLDFKEGKFIITKTFNLKVVEVICPIIAEKISR
jgi:hypothetical protein